jgi:hypothetical protein
MVESGVDGVKFTLNFGLKGLKFGIGRRNFRSHSLDDLCVLFGFGLQVKEFLVARGGHLGMMGFREGVWVHKKNKIEK